MIYLLRKHDIISVPRALVMHHRAKLRYHRYTTRSDRNGSVSKNLFGTLGDCQKGSEDEQLTPVGVYRYGRV